MLSESYNSKNATIEDINILIVEDDVLIADSLRLSLKALGYGVAEPCLTVNEALQSLNNDTFDLAILDIDFNGKDDGIYLGAYIRDHCHFPFIFLTAYNDVSTVAKATQVSPSGYLIKPTSSATLFTTIQTALHNYTQQITAIKAEMDLSKESFFAKNNGVIHRYRWKDICCIESSKNYAILTTLNDSPKRIALRGTLVHILSLMPALYSIDFVQINRGCFVQINQISQVSKANVWIGNKKYILSNKYRKNLTDRLPII